MRNQTPPSSGPGRAALHAVLAVVIAALGYGAGAFAESSRGAAPMAPPDHAPEANDGHDELQRLRAENVRLREAATQAEPRRNVAVDAAATKAPEPPPDLSWPGGSDDASVERAVDMMLLGLEEQLRSGQLRAHALKSPMSLTTLVLRGWLDAGLPDRALADMRRLPPGTVPVQLAGELLKLMEERGDKGSARDAALIGLRNEPQSNAFLDALARLDPEAGLSMMRELIDNDPLTADPEYEYQRLRLLLACNRTEEVTAAIASMRAAAQGRGDQSGPNVESRLMSLLADNAPKLALEYLTPDKVGDNRSLQLQRVKALRGSGDAQAAKTEVLALLEKNPTWRSAWNQLVEIDPAEALRLFDQRPDANDQQRPFGRATLLEKLGRKDEAIATYESMLGTNPSAALSGLMRLAPERARPLALTHGDDEVIGDLADIAWTEGRREEAVSLWREAMRKDPGDSEWRNKLRRVQQRLDPLRN